MRSFRVMPTGPSLKLRFLPLKINGWKMKFPFGVRPIFRCELLVSGSVLPGFLLVKSSRHNFLAHLPMRSNGLSEKTRRGLKKEYFHKSPRFWIGKYTRQINSQPFKWLPLPFHDLKVFPCPKGRGTASVI